MLLEVTMPLLRPRLDGLYELAEDWFIETSFGLFVIRAGFITDGASVPRMAWLFAGHPMESPRVLAALVHDWIYMSHAIPREIADLIYKEILERFRAKWRVWVEWKALVWFGRAAWESHDLYDQNFARKHGAFVPKTKRKTK